MKNKIVVITGGASGIGFAIAKLLTNDNTVISVDRNPSKIESLKSALPKVISIKADITSIEELDNAISIIEKTQGKIDVLLNNAGKGSSFDFINAAEKDLMAGVENEISINYYAPIRLTKKALPLLKKSSEPTVVIISSGLAYIPLSLIGSYCASKAAIHFVTLALRHQLAGEKIRVVEVLPPVVDTDLSKSTTVKKMPADTFAKIFLKKLASGKNIMNIGQTGALEKMSRLMPQTAFKMLNRM